MTIAVPRPARSSGEQLVAALGRHGPAPAAVTETGMVSYGQLAAQVAEHAAALGTARRLVLLEGERSVAWLAGYLAALAAGCPVLLVPPGSATDGSPLLEAYDPDVRMTTDGGQVRLHEVRASPAQRLHPDLALLLSTSGSTGSPKLVRLSGANLLANAASVAQSLRIRPTDRAITTLPVHYCYGLSVVHSHLLRGAALVLTERPVTDPAFWRLFARAGATTFAAVPYTFDLLDSVGFRDMELPRLRYVTQAGGRLDPARVRSYAELGVERGWDLVVMYGQTEATARMAVLPPDRVAARPTAIGRPVPGGSFELEPIDGGSGAVPDGDVGELVYRGPNVMLGYASGRGDLSRGACLDRLRTGDLARRAPDGLYEVVGRRSRFVKLFGLRLDQGHLEDSLRGPALDVCCEPTADGGLGVLVEGAVPVTHVLERVVSMTGLPRHAVHVVAVDRLPRRDSGKIDHAAARAALLGAAARPLRDVHDVRGVLAEILGVEPRAEDTFVALGGDSLSYVEVTVALERVLGHVPADWHTTTVRDLTALAAAAPSGAPVRPTLDVTVALRAMAILLVVGSHSKLFDVLGGAHLLLVLAGYNLARFSLSADRRARCAAVARSLRRIVVPAAAWIAGAALLTGQYGWQNVVLLNHVLGPDEWALTWSFWFLEALVALLVLVPAVLALGPVDRWQRGHPFGFAVVLCGAGLLVRFDVLPVPTGPGGRFTAQAVLWLFALGMAAAAASRRRERAVVAGLAVWGLHGWFGDVQRELVILAGVLVLLAVTRLPSSRGVTWLASTLASASLYIYVTHWQVYPLWQHEVPALAFAASLAVGLAYWQLVGRAGRVAALARAALVTRPDSACGGTEPARR